MKITNTPLVTLELIPYKVGITYTPLVTWDSLYSGDYIYTPGYLGSSPLQWKGDYTPLINWELLSRDGGGNCTSLVFWELDTCEGDFSMYIIHPVYLGTSPL